ncbi:Protein CLEC-48, partial [Aphelenchoides avenae]
TFHHDYSTWFAANSTCTSEGGILVSIHSDEEQRFVKRLSGTGVQMNWKSGAWDGGVWIGMIGVTNDTRTHYWSDGTRIDFDNWPTGQPNYYNRCTAYYPDHLIGQAAMWVDHWDNTVPCYWALRAFVCKKASSA